MTQPAEAAYPGLLLGLFLVGETDIDSGHMLGLVRPPRDQHLKAFRALVASALPGSAVVSRQYAFLTLHGWEINEDLEETVRIHEVATTDGLVRIRFVYQRPKLGIVVKGRPGPDIPLGFLFCDFRSTVRDLFVEIERQLPSLSQAFVASSLFFLDRNGWPVSREQEALLDVIEIVTNNTVHVSSFRGHYTHRPSFQAIAQRDVLSPNPAALQGRPVSPTVVYTSASLPVSSMLPLQDPNGSCFLSPVTETADLGMETVLGLKSAWGGAEGYNESLKQSLSSASCNYEILLSYVHSEASDLVCPLKEALQALGYSVFLDIDCIHGGVDWQDTLNEAISNCCLFVPLITMQYGNTLWTNREIKLADVLGKTVIPVNLLNSWPPKCLAIQFAATQFIAWGKSEEAIHHRATAVATSIAEHYQRDLQQNGSDQLGDSLATQPLDKTVPAMEVSPTASSPLLVPKRLSSLRKAPSVRKKSTLKSYASDLPESLPATYRQEIQESRQGKPLVVISCHPAQREGFVDGLVRALERKDCEVWCSTDIGSAAGEGSQERLEKGMVFQEKADEAGVVVFVLSKEFASSSFCEEQVYYCEQRKRIIPLIFEPIQMPNWMAMLIGTSTFVSCQSSSYMATLLERVQSALSPSESKEELKEMLKQKAKIAQLCTSLSDQLPHGKHVYISGGTSFFSACGKEVCQELGKQFAKDPEIVLVTGGFFGVGETVGQSFFEERKRLGRPHGVCHVVAERDDQDKSFQTRQNADGSFPAVPYGDTLFVGDSVRERETVTPKVLDLCVLIEGGPGAAFEAQQFVWNSHRVVPMQLTGGAAGGKFNVPQSIFVKPAGVAQADWSLLREESATPAEVAAATVRIARVLLSEKPLGAGCSSPLLKPSLPRSDTMPVRDSADIRSATSKRTLSTSDSPIPFNTRNRKK